jgi:hypothetical protein
MSGSATVKCSNTGGNLNTINLYEFLVSKPDITNLVGQRIYPGMLPQSAVFPAITWHCYGTSHDYYTTGAAGWADARYQIDVWAYTYGQATTISELVRDKLQGFSGFIGEGWVHVAILENEETLYEQPAHSDDMPIHHVAQQYKILFPETLPSLA